MTNLQIDNKSTKQVRIDSGLHKLLKVKAAKRGVSIKTLLEECLTDLLSVDNEAVDNGINFSTKDYGKISV